MGVPGASSAEYAENFRKQLLSDLFDGNEVDAEAEALAAKSSIQDVIGDGGILSLEGVDKDLEEFQDHVIIKAILEQGKVVKEYTREIDEQLRKAEMESIQDYISQSTNMISLHQQIKKCDGILEGMESMLSSFQSDLGKVSEEIRQLQVQSQTMGTKLKNRRTAESQIGNFIEQLTISEELVNTIMEQEVSEEYAVHLAALDEKLRYVRQDDIARTSYAKRDVEPALEKLRVKAVTKVREFMLHKVLQLKRPKTNVQIIQDSVLLKYKTLMHFLRWHAQDVYGEIRTEYVSVLSRILATHIRSYLTAMERMQTVVVGLGDVLGAPDGGPGAAAGLGGMFVRQGQRPATEAAFALGERGAVLQDLERPAMIAHMAEHEGKKLPYEVIFRNVHKLLLETGVGEAHFCAKFFPRDEQVLSELLGPLIGAVEQDLAHNLQDMSDPVCLMLMIRINAEHRRFLARGLAEDGLRVPPLDQYLDRVHLILWPRLKIVHDAQLSSVRTGMEKALFNDNVGAHFVTRRYAALASSYLVLMAGCEQDDTGAFKAQSFHDMMDRLSHAMHDLLLRICNCFSSRRHGIVFLALNYHHLLATLRAAEGAQLAEGSGGVGSGFRSESPSNGSHQGSPRSSSTTVGGLGAAGLVVLKDIEGHLASSVQLYVEDQLSVHFKDLVDYVKQAEQAQRRHCVTEGHHIPSYGPEVAQPIVRDFASRWQGAIEAMRSEVMAEVSDAACAREVLQASMTALLKHYTRLLELLKRQGAEGLVLVKEAVNVPSIMYEIKKITKAAS